MVDEKLVLDFNLELECSVRNFENKLTGVDSLDVRRLAGPQPPTHTETKTFRSFPQTYLHFGVRTGRESAVT